MLALGHLGSGQETFNEQSRKLGDTCTLFSLLVVYLKNKNEPELSDCEATLGGGGGEMKLVAPRCQCYLVVVAQHPAETFHV